MHTKPLATYVTCPRCGQRARDQRCAACGTAIPLSALPLREAASSVLRRLGSFLTAAAHSCWRLLVRPGRLAQDYFEGRADKDIPPWSLFTLTAAAAAVMTGGFSLDGSILQYLTVDVWFSADDFQARAPVFGTDAVTWLLLLIAVPVYTACLRALFPTRRTGEHFVVALHVLSFAMLCLIGDAVLLRLAAPLGATRAATLASALLVPAAFVAYLYATLRRLHPSYDVIDVGWRLVALVVLHGAAAAAAGRLLSRLHGMLAG